MFQVSKKSQYGLRAAVFLARKSKNKKPVPIKKIAESEAIPFSFLEKIILQLEKARLVKGKKGIGGGYVLSYSPAKISVKDIVSALEGEKPVVNCLLCRKSRKCAAKNVWSRVETSLNKTLKSITLADLIK